MKKPRNPQLIAPKNVVKVTLTRTPEGKYNLNVGVMSCYRKGLKASKDLDPGQFANATNLQQAVQIAGGACAEHLCEKYGEPHDPSICAQNALKDMVREFELSLVLQKSLEEKMARAQAKPQLPFVRQRLDKLLWTVRRGEPPTPDDADFVDGLLAADSRAGK